MRTICFYFQVHQPYRLRRYRFFDIGDNHYYYDDFANRTIMRKVAEKCYLPANQVFLDLIKEFGSRFKISYSISGTALDQFEKFAPDVLESFQRLAKTGCVEFLAETYSHSLSALKCKEEFAEQVKMQSEKIQKLFGKKPTVFRNTELIYSDSIGEMVGELGFNAMLTEGAKHILGWKSPNFVYCNANSPKLKVLLKNFRLSDDIAFRFSNREWSEWPLTAEKFVSWVNALDKKEEIINLFMDYETFGEHQWAETGIFEFLRALPSKAYESNICFSTPSEVIQNFDPVGAFHVMHPISWADEERDLTAWLGNELQDDAFNHLYALKEKVKKINDDEIQRDWKFLQTSDHFYYMCTKWFSDGDVHKYFNPYNTPYEAYINYMNILSDFVSRIESLMQLDEDVPEKISKEELDALIQQHESRLKKLKAKTKAETITPAVKASARSKKETKSPLKKVAVKTKLDTKPAVAKVPAKAKKETEPVLKAKEKTKAPAAKTVVKMKKETKPAPIKKTVKTKARKK